MFAFPVTIITAYTHMIKIWEAVHQIIHLFRECFLNIKNIGLMKFK